MQETATYGMDTTNILIFYGWWQMSVCLFAFLGLMAIWWHIGKRQGDIGQVWLAFSILSWSFSGMVEVVFAEQPASMQKDIYVDGLRSIFSLFNSLFILLALPWFRYLPKGLKPIIQSKYWIFVIGLPFVFSLLPTISKIISLRGSGFINELDVYYALLTLIFLGYVLWESFAKRRLKVLSWLSIVCIITTLIAQAYKLTDSQINLILFSAIFKTSLIMIFFALALSWVKELSEIIIPSSEVLGISLSRKKIEHKFVNEVVISGIPGKTSTIDLSPTLFDLFLKFANQKINGDKWLEIKPKKDPRSGHKYDINDHNEIKRLIYAILEGLFGKGNWTKELHEIPLKASIFEMSEKRERKIRLSVPAGNIMIAKELTIQSHT